MFSWLRCGRVVGLAWSVTLCISGSVVWQSCLLLSYTRGPIVLALSTLCSLVGSMLLDTEREGRGPFPVAIQWLRGDGVRWFLPGAAVCLHSVPSDAPYFASMLLMCSCLAASSRHPLVNLLCIGGVAFLVLSSYYLTIIVRGFPQHVVSFDHLTLSAKQHVSLLLEI